MNVREDVNSNTLNERTVACAKTWFRNLNAHLGSIRRYALLQLRSVIAGTHLLLEEAYGVLVYLQQRGDRG